jgi:putative ABC transport system permease protein
MPLYEFNATFERPEVSYKGAFSVEPIQFPEDVTYNVVTLEEKIAGVEQIIAPTAIMIAVVMTVAFVIAVLVIYVVTTLIVEENKDIIALMKVFGYRRKEINGLILNSSTVVVIIGYLIGIPLTNVAVGTLTQTMEDMVGLALPPANLALPYLLLGFVVVMLAYEISKWLCRKKVSSVSMSEALKVAME